MQLRLNQQGHQVVINPDFVALPLTPFFLKKYYQPVEQILYAINFTAGHLNRSWTLAGHFLLHVL